MSSLIIIVSYPNKPPEIIITAPRLIPDQISLVQKLLQSYSETLINQPMILSIYSRLLKWFDENNIQALTINTNNNTSTTPRSPTNGKTISSSIPNNNNHTKTAIDEHNQEDLKKSSMKTVEDVKSRIEWDTNLDKQYIRVGYIDPFLGLQEKPFNDFDFNLALTSINDHQTNNLSIPKYRIQYFKYGNEIIWDKKSRIDLLFGSTGNQQTISDVIKRHENLIETK